MHYTEEFIIDRLNHYKLRLSEATSVQERSFLRGEVHRFKMLMQNQNK
jgi:hypothetical protein